MYGKFIFFSLFFWLMNNFYYLCERKLISADPLRKLYYFLLFFCVVCAACQFKWNPMQDDNQSEQIKIKRFDRLEYRYLTTGDFSALQEMNTEYPMEFRTLLEDVLKIGEVRDPEINSKFLNFYQDTTLQSLIASAEAEYSNMDDLNKDFNHAFDKLKSWLPGIKVPEIYAQISALDQSVIIGDESIGISLDKYLGKNYPLYKKYYPENQRSQMTRNMILPDCISFYLMSQYPLKNMENKTQRERDLQMAKMMCITNHAVGRKAFNTPYVKAVEKFMHSGQCKNFEELLEITDFSKFEI